MNSPTGQTRRRIFTLDGSNDADLVDSFLWRRVEGCYQFCCLVNKGTMGVSSLPKTVT